MDQKEIVIIFGVMECVEELVVNVYVNIHGSC